MRYTRLVLNICAALLLLGGVCLAPARAQHAPMAARAALSNFQILPASVIGGKAATASLTLNNPAPAGGAIVTLFSNSKAAQPARSVLIPGGLRTINFSINTAPVQSDMSAMLSATYNGVTLTAPLVVHPTPAALLLLYSDASEALGGSGAHTGTVLLNARAPLGGAIVALSSSNAAITLPATVTVLAGDTAAFFTFTPNAVANDLSVTLTASYYGVSKASHFIVRAPSPLPLTLQLRAEDVQSGDSGYLTITLSGVATKPITVTITSDDPSLLYLWGTQVIPVGYDSLMIPFHTRAVIRNTAVNINASINGSTSSTSVVLYAPRN